MWLLPFSIAAGFVGFIVMILLVAFWIWMIIDCAKRKFRNDVEKIIWIVVIVFATWLGSVVYFIVVKCLNPHGVYRR